jgi:hypothetical protein
VGIQPNQPQSAVLSRNEPRWQLLEGLTPDPANPVGYRAHLYSVAKVNDVARSYVEEGVECYVSSFYKAAAVMTGAAAESIILELRDLLLDKLKGLGRNSPKDLDDWRIKRILDAMPGFFSSQKASLGAELREEFEAYWAAFSQQVRAVRNEAGHPSSVDQVTPDVVHASLLIFPELAKLQSKLAAWVGKLASCSSNNPLRATRETRALERRRSAAEGGRAAKVKGGHKLGPDLRATKLGDSA